MSNEVVKLNFTPDQVGLIKSQIAPKATDDELRLFIYQAKRTGLDPLARQIYAIHRKVRNYDGSYSEKMSIQTSIDGFRVIAERSGDYGGQDEPQFIKTEEGKLYCKVTVYRFKGDVRYPAAVGVAYWNEYVQTDKEGKPSGLWAKMPHTMLSKVAEALALRKAYPQDLSGLYTSEEMNQTENTVKNETVEESDKAVLRQLIYDTDLTAEEKEQYMAAIDLCPNYKAYQKIQFDLEARQQPFDTIANPSQGDIKKIVKKIAGNGISG